MKGYRLIFQLNNVEFYEIEENNSKEFLKSATKKGYKWFTGEEIVPEKDKLCGRFMMITSKGTISTVSLGCMAEISRKYKNSVAKEKEKNLCERINFDEPFQE